MERVAVEPTVKGLVAVGYSEVGLGWGCFTTCLRFNYKLTKSLGLYRPESRQDVLGYAIVHP